MRSPRLRTANKVQPPYPINKFPSEFINKFGEEIVYMLATKSPMSIEGDEWERIFANCVGAEWKPSNIGLDDVALSNCCWSAKTVKSSRREIQDQKEVRLISGRCSPVYSYDSEGISSESDPDKVGEMVLGIWNERVSAIREIYKFARTVVLVKGKEYDEFLVFEIDTIRYDPSLYSFSWNANGNLEGFEKTTEKHRFTWQPHGSQLTIIEDIPPERLHLKVRRPEKLKMEDVLDAVGYQEYWVMSLDDSGDQEA